MGRAAVDSRVNHTTLNILNGARGYSAPLWVEPFALTEGVNNYEVTREYVLTPASSYGERRSGGVAQR